MSSAIRSSGVIRRAFASGSGSGPTSAIPPAALQPSFVNGRWRKPQFSALRRARAGIKLTGTADPVADLRTRLDRLSLPAPPKGTAAARKGPARRAQIAAAMKGMPKLLAERPKGGFSIRMQRKEGREIGLKELVKQARALGKQKQQKQQQKKKKK